MRSQEEINAYGRRLYAKNIEKQRERAKEYHAAHKQEKAANTNKRYRETKDAAFARYGGYTCSCCGEVIRQFLAIDHINGGWSAEQKRRGYRGHLYRWLKSHGYPDGFRVLCHNCNLGRHLNGGICPHEEMRNAAGKLEEPAGAAGLEAQSGKEKATRRTAADRV